MANHENVIYDTDLVHCYVALRRRKHNPSLPQGCIRQIIRNESEDLEIIKLKLKSKGGYWRIHRTVNRRSIKKAWKVLQHKIIDDPEIPFKLESAWKTALLQSGGKGERKFLLDIDTKFPELITPIEELLLSNGIEVLEIAESPNGFHYVTKPFDFQTVLGHLDYVDLLRDGYVFIEEFK